MKLLFLLSLSFFLSNILSAQSVSVQIDQEYSSNNLTTFPIKGGNFIKTNSLIRVDGNTESVEYQTPIFSDVSAEGGKIGVVDFDGELVKRTIDHSGVELSTTELEFFDSSDQTISLHQLESGKSIARDNVANFTFFDADGKQVYSVSNSGQSQDGEQTSELATSRLGSTVVLYNPEIRRNGSAASRARLVFGEEDNEIFLDENDRVISFLDVSDSGSFITSITQNESSNDELTVFDRFGNEIFQMSSDINLKGAVLSENADYLTIYSESRVQVYNVSTGERLGSSTSQSPILKATYFAEDEVVLVFNGSENDGTINDPGITAIHLGLRQIARNDINANLSALDVKDLKIEREGASSYTVKGINQPVTLTVNF
ncbi:MAG: hypothetical protein WD381_04145 [Balneolaceae bacterium]